MLGMIRSMSLNVLTFTKLCVQQVRFGERFQGMPPRVHLCPSFKFKHDLNINFHSTWLQFHMTPHMAVPSWDPVYMSLLGMKHCPVQSLGLFFTSLRSKFHRTHLCRLPPIGLQFSSLGRSLPPSTHQPSSLARSLPPSTHRPPSLARPWAPDSDPLSYLNSKNLLFSSSGP
jgi:hypothetical protein